jgi:hypothetical protein
MPGCRVLAFAGVAYLKSGDDGLPNRPLQPNLYAPLGLGIGGLFVLGPIEILFPTEDARTGNGGSREEPGGTYRQL